MNMRLAGLVGVLLILAIPVSARAQFGLSIGFGDGGHGHYGHGYPGYYGHGHGGHGNHSSTGEVLMGVGAILNGVGAVAGNSQPDVVVVPQPVYVPQPANYGGAYSDLAEASVTPPTNARATSTVKANIKIINPKTNTQTLGYTLDGKWTYQIGPGQQQQLDQPYEIAFDRGGTVTRYSLTSGIYTFTPQPDGAWELYNSQE